MEQFKIEHFKKNNPTQSFPRFVVLKSEEAMQLSKSLAHRLNLMQEQQNIDGIVLLQYIHNIAVKIENMDATLEDFDILKLIQQINLRPNEEVYINWNNFKMIDRITFNDLVKYFDDIWYPSSDDIEIFDDTFSWILIINHYGIIEIAML